MYLIGVYIPKSHLESVKHALFDAGAGRIGEYAQCAWQVEGEGQFQPLAGSQPHCGSVGRTERVVEYKVEMVCRSDCLKAVIQALLSAHPYEEPAYFVCKTAPVFSGKQAGALLEDETSE